jgi:hypothetical protein
MSSGAWDLDQPAKLWLGTLIFNLGALLAKGHEPSMDLEINGVEFQFRVKPEFVARFEVELGAAKERAAAPPAEGDMPDDSKPGYLGNINPPGCDPDVP